MKLLHSTYLTIRRPRLEIIRSVCADWHALPQQSPALMAINLIVRIPAMRTLAFAPPVLLQFATSAPALSVKVITCAASRRDSVCARRDSPVRVEGAAVVEAVAMVDPRIRQRRLLRALVRTILTSMVPLYWRR